MVFIANPFLPPSNSNFCSSENSTLLPCRAASRLSKRLTAHLAPLSWVKMLWRLLHYFNVHLHMESQTIPLPRERDQVVMEILLRKNLETNTILSLSGCRGALKIIFLSDMTTANGQYLEQFVFNPGSQTSRSTYKYPQEIPTKGDWEVWFNFWHEHTATGDKLHVPLRK